MGNSSGDMAERENNARTCIYSCLLETTIYRILNISIMHMCTQTRPLPRFQFVTPFLYWCPLLGSAVYLWIWNTHSFWPLPIHKNGLFLDQYPSHDKSSCLFFFLFFIFFFSESLIVIKRFKNAEEGTLRNSLTLC